MNRPPKFNAWDQAMFEGIEAGYKYVNLSSEDIRCVVLAGNGKNFTAGLDLAFAGSMAQLEGEDVARKSFA